MTKIIIRPVKLRDVGTLRRLFVYAVRNNFTYFPPEYQDRVIYDHRSSKLMLAAVLPRRIVLAAYNGGKIIGYAIGSVPKQGAAQIYWLYVSPEGRGKNTGLSLLSRMLKIQRKLGALRVSLATYDHRHYYERQGFRLVGREQIEGLELDVLTFDMHS